MFEESLRREVEKKVKKSLKKQSALLSENQIGELIDFEIEQIIERILK